MSMKKKASAILLTAVMSLGLLAGCADAGPAGDTSNPAGTETPGGETYLIKYATVRSSEHSIEVLVQEYFDRLERESGGRLKFECYWDGSMGSAREIAESSYAGTIDMFWGGSGDLTIYAPVAEILTNPPFVYKDEEHAARVLDAVWDDACVLIEKAGFKPLYHSYQGTRQLISIDPIYKLSDMAGVKKRTVNTEYFMGLFKVLGAEPAAIDLSEMYTAMQTGVVKAGGGDLSMIYTKGWYEIAKNLTMYNAICVQGIPAMNLKTFNALPRDLQDLMLDAGKDMVIRGNESVGKSDAEYLQKLIDVGVNVIYPTEEAMAEFRAAVADYTENYARQLGDDVYAIYEKMISVE